MKIVKSLHGSMMHRCFSYQDKHYFTATVMWGFRLTTGEAVMEQALWSTIGESFAGGEIFDTGMPKPVAEFLAHGCCCAPAGETVNASNVTVQFAGITKELAVFGDRHWIKTLGIGAGVSDPVPFSMLPLTYGRAFGGKDYAINPAGIGIDSIDVEGEQVQPLPNIEYPKQLIGAPKDRPDPAGFSRIDQMADQRIRRGGTYDQNYIDTTMPDFPNDINLETFNDAATDQWLPGFPGGEEAFSITGMHPEHTRIQGALPGIRGRCFVEQQVDGNAEFREIDTRIDTVHFLPNHDLGIIMYRGTIEVAEDDGADISKILVAHENLADDRRSDAHYREQMAFRTDPEESYKYIMNTVPLIPVGTQCGFSVLIDQHNEAAGKLMQENISNFSETRKAEMEAEKDKAVQQQVDSLKAGGGDTKPMDDALSRLKEAETNAPPDSEEARKIKEIADKIAPPKDDGSPGVDMTKIDLKALDELKALMAKIAVDQKKAADDRMLQQIEDTRKQGFDKEADRLQALYDEMKLPPLLPRADTARMQAQIEAMQAEVDKEMHKLQSMGMLNEGTVSKLDEVMKKNREQMQEASEKSLDGYRMGAHAVGKSRSPHEGREPEIRDGLLREFRAGGKTAGGDYAFIELSGQDLKGVDLSGAYLEYAILDGCDLSGANLEGAILAHATITNTKLTGCKLDRANVGAARISGCDFSDSSVREIVLQRSEITDTSFARCDLSERMDLFMETSLHNVDFTDGSLCKDVFIDIDFSECNFSGCNLAGAVYINPVLDRSGFDGADLSGVNFVFASADHATFRNSKMVNVRFVGGSRLDSSDFSGSNISESNLRDAELSHANFTGALMNKADFGNSNLRYSIFDNAIGHETQFNKSDLEHASLRKADFMEGSMYKARISSASFINASLYNVNFNGCTHGGTDFTGADLKQTIFRDWHP